MNRTRFSSTDYAHDFRANLSPIVCTFLIPALLEDWLNRRLANQSMLLGIYLARLVSATRDPHRGGSNFLPRASQLTACYQAAGQDLQTRNFRVDPFVWHELKRMSAAHGMSACHMFILLLQADMMMDLLTGTPTYGLKGMRFHEAVNVLRLHVSRQLQRIDSRSPSSAFNQQTDGLPPPGNPRPS